MEFREQEYIISIAESQSITKAAEHLHVSQPALSKFLSAVEEELGVTLFIRTNKSFSITPAGELYLEKAKQIIRCRDEFHLSLQKLSEKQPFSLTIGIQKLRAPRLTPIIYASFYRSFPGCKLTFIESYGENLFHLLKEGQLDLILCNQYKRLPELALQTLGEDDLLLIASEEKALPCSEKDSRYPAVNLNDILDETFLLLTEKTSLRILVDSILRQYSLHLEHSEEIKRQEASLHLASMGYGLAFTLSSYLPLFQFSRPVKCYHILQHRKPIPFVAASLPGHFPPRLEKKISNMLSEAMDITKF